MSILALKKSREEWLEDVYTKSHSCKSRNAYREAIKKWDAFLAKQNMNEGEILEQFKKNNTATETYVFLNEFVQFMARTGVKRNTINVSFAALRSWCVSNGVMLFNEYIKTFVKPPTQNRETRIPLTNEIIKSLVSNATDTVKVVLLFVLSSGMRISECLQLTVVDINQNTNPIEIRLRAETTKSREERIAYISNEAWILVKPLLLNKNPTDLIFTKKFTEYSLISFETRFSRLRKKCGFISKYDDDRTYHVNVPPYRFLNCPSPEPELPNLKIKSSDSA